MHSAGTWAHVTLFAKIAILDLVLRIILPSERHSDHVSNDVV